MYQSPWSESLNSLSKAEGYIELPHFTITVLVVNMFVACILWDHAHDLYFQNMWRCVPAPPHWHCPAPRPPNSPTSHKTPPANKLSPIWYSASLRLAILSQINYATNVLILLHHVLPICSSNHPPPPPDKSCTKWIMLPSPSSSFSSCSSPQILLLHQINLATAVQLHQVNSCSPLLHLPSQAPLPSWHLGERWLKTWSWWFCWRDWWLWAQTLITTTMHWWTVDVTSLWWKTNPFDDGQMD